MFAAYLRATRKKKGQTQVEAARACRVHENTWSGWERGHRPDIQSLFRLADWAGVSVDELRPHLLGERP